MGEVLRKTILFCLILSTAVHSLPAPEDSGQREVDSAIQPALGWLIGRRGLDFGWGADTARALLALVRTGPQAAGWDPKSLEGQLSSKQMDIELLSTLLKKKSAGELHPGLLAQYVLTLTALCRDPKDFYGNDLLGNLMAAEDPQHAFTFAFNILSVCASGGHIKRRHVRKLLEIAEIPAGETPHNTDTLAMVVMATACISHNSTKYRNLHSFLEQPLLHIASKQQNDGSFDSNIPSTSLAYQALRLGADLGIHVNSSAAKWKPEAALNWLKAAQKSDGSFGDLFTTTEALMALSNKGYAAISWEDCLSRDGSNESLPLLRLAKDSQASDPSPVSTTTEKSTKNSITFNYLLWIGQNRSEIHDLQLTVPRNTTFFEAMKVAAELDSHYEFSATVWPNGHYVHTISGHKEQAIGFHFWLLFRVPFKPDPEHPPPTTYVAPAGVDDLFPDDGEYYLFWFKNV